MHQKGQEGSLRRRLAAGQTLPKLGWVRKSADMAAIRRNFGPADRQNEGRPGIFVFP